MSVEEKEEKTEGEEDKEVFMAPEGIPSGEPLEEEKREEPAEERPAEKKPWWKFW